MGEVLQNVYLVGLDPFDLLVKWFTLFLFDLRGFLVLPFSFEPARAPLGDLDLSVLVGHLPSATDAFVEFAFISPALVIHIVQFTLEIVFGKGSVEKVTAIEYASNCTFFHAFDPMTLVDFATPQAAYDEDAFSVILTSLVDVAVVDLIVLVNSGKFTNDSVIDLLVREISKLGSFLLDTVVKLLEQIIREDRVFGRFDFHWQIQFWVS